MNIQLKKFAAKKFDDIKVGESFYINKIKYTKVEPIEYANKYTYGNVHTLNAIKSDTVLYVFIDYTINCYNDVNSDAVTFDILDIGDTFIFDSKVFVKIEQICYTTGSGSKTIFHKKNCFNCDANEINYMHSSNLVIPAKFLLTQE